MNVVDYVRAKSEEGEFQDTRDFTINTLKARQKLSELQLCGPGLWLVKLVQCAVRLKADSVSIKTGKRLIKVEFSAADGPTAETIARHLLDGSLPADSALSHLLTGLRSSLAGHTKSLTLLVEGRGTCTVLRLGQDGTEVLQNPSSHRESCVRYVLTVIRPKRPIPLSDLFRTSIKGLLNNIVEELRAVETRCWCSPIPVTIDNRRIDQPFPSNATRYLADVEWLGAPANRDLEHGDRWFALRWFDVPGCQSLDHLDPSVESKPPRKLPFWAVKATREIFLNIPRQEENSVFFLSGTKSVRSGIDFILDGAVVYQTTLKFDMISVLSNQFKGSRLALRIFRTVRSDQVDLSHFQLRNPDREVKLTLASVAEPFRETFRRLEREVKERWPTFGNLMRAEDTDVVTKSFLLLFAPISLPSSMVEFHVVNTMLRSQGGKILTFLAGPEVPDDGGEHP